MEKLIERYKTEVFDYKAGGLSECCQYVLCTVHNVCTVKKKQGLQKYELNINFSVVTNVVTPKFDFRVMLSILKLLTIV